MKKIRYILIPVIILLSTLICLVFHQESKEELSTAESESIEIIKNQFK